MSTEEKDEEEQLTRDCEHPGREIVEIPAERSGSREETKSETDPLSSKNSSGKSKGSFDRRKSREDIGPTRTETGSSVFQGPVETDNRLTKSWPADNKESPPSSTKLDRDGDSYVSSTGDICRICHMGGFPALLGSRPMWEWPNRGVGRVASQISTLSSYAYLGPLISVCKGTIGLVHTECLERWLTESGHTRCELCGHRYSTKKVPRHGIFRSIVIWFNTVIATRQMLLDVLYLFVTTPLALFSCYVCALALKMIVEGGFQDIPWMIVAMLPTCSLTLVAYWGWLITLGRLHGRRWRRFWRNNFVVRLVPESSGFFLDTGTSFSDSVRERTEYRTARRIDYEDNEFFFDRFPDEDDDDDDGDADADADNDDDQNLFRIVDNILQP